MHVAHPRLGLGESALERTLCGVGQGFVGLTRPKSSERQALRNVLRSQAHTPPLRPRRLLPMSAAATAGTGLPCRVMCLSDCGPSCRCLVAFSRVLVSGFGAVRDLMLRASREAGVAVACLVSREPIGAHPHTDT